MAIFTAGLKGCRYESWTYLGHFLENIVCQMEMDGNEVI